MAQRRTITDPAPKYGPTAEYGSCEATGCHAAARVACAECDGHFCLGHAAEAAHAPAEAAHVSA